VHNLSDSDVTVRYINNVSHGDYEDAPTSRVPVSLVLKAGCSKLLEYSYRIVELKFERNGQPAPHENTTFSVANALKFTQGTPSFKYIQGRQTMFYVFIVVSIIILVVGSIGIFT